MGAQDKMTKSWNGVAKLFNDPKYSDVTIQISDVIFFAHRNVICSQSKYFEAALQEGSQQFLEAGTRSIVFKEGSGAAYWRVLEYLYTGDYSDSLSTAQFIEDPELIKDVRVHALADMFLIDDLKELAETKLEKKLQNRQADAYTIVVDCAREIYENTQKSDYKIRNMVVDCLIRFGQSRIDNRSYSSSSKPSQMFSELNGIRKLISDVGEFADDYLLGTLRLKKGPNGLSSNSSSSYY
ncbi:hypothetical protein K3495_g12255 [Podosphaera aphanis]|nr:hypothetical protein K3495_g12255 [Podosphaera aphanis]